ncbi:PIG-L family deacetylase [Sediminibacterium sp. WSJ-3]|nr:PIG-L family deacetylase [Sediminibacterium soli]
MILPFKAIRSGYCILFCLLVSSLTAQVAPPAYTSAEIYNQIRKLNVLGSVLYVAAHPDDENNGFLPYLAKEKLYRTGYLSLTRGDGGQNLIGSEQGIELGMIRTEELLAARQIDGAEQYFSSAYEFGFSKNSNEALRIWDKEQVLSDIVWVIRKFQPDVIITRFPADARAGHGHHWASAILANEAFTAAADPARFPEQFKRGVTVWQAKRILLNGFNFGANTVSGPLKIDVGGFDPLLGKSSGELGGEARSMHKSQGEGRPRRRGEIIENFMTTGGDTPRNDLMEDITTDWTRIEGGAAVKAKIGRILGTYNFEHPENSVDSLVDLYKTIQRLTDHGVWWSKKMGELKELIINCSGIFAEATTREEYVLQNDTALVSVSVNKRNNVPVKLSSVGIDFVKIDPNQQLEQNRNYNFDIREQAREPKIENMTQPYWLQQPQKPGNFTITNPLLVGKAWNDALFNASFHFEIGGVEFRITRPVQYKYVDPVKGEVYQPFVMIPHLSISMSPHVALMNVRGENGKVANDSIKVTYRSNFTQQNVPTTLHILQDTLKPAFSNQPRDFEKGKTYTVSLPLKKYYNPSKGTDIESAMGIWVDKKNYVNSQYFKTVAYDHIPTIHYSFKDRIHFVNEEVRTVGRKIGYINGAGDKLPEALTEMGYEVEVLGEHDITDNNLRQFDAIVIGVRAHNIFEWLSDKNDVLNNYVKNGGNLVSQYIKSNTIGARRLRLGPYPFSISTGSRVTEEEAPVNFLLPQHPVLNYPNKITENDFAGWIQERSTYQADQMDTAFEAPLGMNDTGERQSNGSLITAKYGKGRFTYVSLVLFRQLPAGVPGAYRLLANIIALSKTK